MKILLVKKASGNNYSIEAGLNDGVRNFDHHGEYHNQPCPANNPNIPVIGETDIVEITHLDADTYLGLRRMAGRQIADYLDLELLEQIDLNGSSVCTDKSNETLQYMVGVSTLARTFNFPFPKDEPQDVTEKIFNIAVNDNELCKDGAEAIAKSEKAYRLCRRAISNNTAFFSIGADDNLDPSRAYEDKIDIVVVYRKHYKSISIYVNPSSNFEFAGKTIADIEFAGHPKACGSTRGIEFSEENASKVYIEIVRERIEDELFNSGGR